MKHHHYIPASFRAHRTNSAMRELPHIQKIINKKLSSLDVPFKCWFIPTPAVVELISTANARTIEFRHHVGGQTPPFLPSTRLSKRAARALNMQTELYEVSNLEAYDILRALILQGFRYSGDEEDAEASLLAWMMLEPMRRVTTMRRRAA